MLQAVNKTGGPLGIAILGSVLSARLPRPPRPLGLPPRRRERVRQSVFGGVAVAQQAPLGLTAPSVHAAFIYGMDMAFLVSAGIAIAGVALALVFMPASNAAQTPAHSRAGKEPEAVPAG